MRLRFILDNPPRIVASSTCKIIVANRPGFIHQHLSPPTSNHDEDVRYDDHKLDGIGLCRSEDHAIQ